MLIKMDWTSLYLKTANLNVFILGTGEVATRRANKFLDHGANVKLAGDILDKELINKGAVLASVDDVDDLVQWSDVVVIASGDRELSDYVSKIAENKLLNRADFPDNGNIIVPTSFNIGFISHYTTDMNSFSKNRIQNLSAMTFFKCLLLSITNLA